MKFPDIQRQFKQYCLVERGITAGNCKAIIRTVELLIEFSGTDEIKELTEDVIRQYMCQKSKERWWSPKTFRIYLQELSSFFSWCVKMKYIKENPTKNIEKPRLPKRLPRCLTKEEVSTILGSVVLYPWLTEFESVRNKTMVYFFVYTGVRLQELINLKMRDVDLENREVLIRQGKGSKDRIVPIHPALAVVLKRYIESLRLYKKTGECFFPSSKSNLPLTSKNVRAICTKISTHAGIKFTPHMLRHTFARLSIDADLNLYKLKEIMGHSSITTTQIYLSVSRENIKRSFNTLQLV